MRLFTFYIALFVLILSGCQKPGPVELVDSRPPNSIQIDTTNMNNPSLNITNPQMDSLGLFSTAGGKMFGQIIVAGAVYDGLNEHHIASLAQAVFFDHSHPIIAHRDTIGYKILNVGDLRINGLLFFRTPQLVPLSPPSLLDTLLGYQYSLYNKDGNGGRGFQFNGTTRYDIEGNGITGISAFSETLTTTPVIHVDAPLPGTIIDPTKRFRVQISGNSDDISIIVRRRPQPGSSLNQERILMKLKAQRQGNEIILPPPVLRSLPPNTDAFVLTFLVTNQHIVRISGFPDDVLLQTSYAHHLMLRVKR